VVPSEKRTTFKKMEKRQNGDSVAMIGSISTYGKFFLTATLGTPPQSLKLMPDTGSSDIIVYGSTCQSSVCQQYTNLYSYGSSSSDHSVVCGTAGFLCNTCDSFDGANTCIFKNRYGVNPIVEADGNILREVFSVGDFQNIPVNFGYITNVSDSYDLSPAEGLWGMAYIGLAFSNDTAFQSIVATTGIKNMFSMCLQDNNAFMTFGVDFGSDPRFIFTPITQQLYYSIFISDMKLLGISLGLSSSDYNTPAVVDSGTTLLYLPTTVYNTLITKFKTMNLPGVAGEGSMTIFDGYCYVLTQSQVNSYPNLSIIITDMNHNPQSLDVIPSTYLYTMVSNGHTYWCSGFLDSGNDGVLILGDVFMANFHVVFDRENDRVGFSSPSTCPNSAGDIAFTTGIRSTSTSSATPTTKSITSNQVTSSAITSASITSQPIMQPITSGSRPITSDSRPITSDSQPTSSGQTPLTTAVSQEHLTTSNSFYQLDKLFVVDLS